MFFLSLNISIKTFYIPKKRNKIISKVHLLWHNFLFSYFSFKNILTSDGSGEEGTGSKQRQDASHLPLLKRFHLPSPFACFTASRFVLLPFPFVNISCKTICVHEKIAKQILNVLFTRQKIANTIFLFCDKINFYSFFSLTVQTEKRQRSCQSTSLELRTLTKCSSFLPSCTCRSLPVSLWQALDTNMVL